MTAFDQLGMKNYNRIVIKKTSLLIGGTVP